MKVVVFIYAFSCVCSLSVCQYQPQNYQLVQNNRGYNYNPHASLPPRRQENSPWNIGRSQVDDEDRTRSGGYPEQRNWPQPQGQSSSQRRSAQQARKPKPDAEGSGSQGSSVMDPIQPLPPNPDQWHRPITTAMPPRYFAPPTAASSTVRYRPMVDSENEGSGLGNKGSSPPERTKPGQPSEVQPWSPWLAPNQPNRQTPNVRPPPQQQQRPIPPTPPRGAVNPPRSDEEGSGMTGQPPLYPKVEVDTTRAFVVQTRPPTTTSSTPAPRRDLPEGSGQAPPDQEGSNTPVVRVPTSQISTSSQTSAYTSPQPTSITTQSIRAATLPSTHIPPSTSRVPLPSTTSEAIGQLWSPDNDVWIELEFSGLQYPEYARKGVLNEKIQILQEEMSRNMIATLQSLPGQRRVEFVGVRPGGGLVLLTKLLTREKNQVTFIYVHVLRNAANLNLLSNYSIKAVNEIKKGSVCSKVGEIRCAIRNSCARGEYCNGVPECQSGEDEVIDSCLTCNDVLSVKMMTPRVELNKLTHLQCQGISQCRSVRWYNDGRPLPAFQGKVDLLLPALRPTNLGIYECWAGDKMAVFQVNLQTAPVIRVVPDREVVKLVRIPTNEEHLPMEQRRASAEIMCGTDANSATGDMIVVRWIPPRKHWSHGVQSVRVNDSQVKLLFSLAAEELAGNYTCEIRYGLNASQEVRKQIQVLGPCDMSQEYQCPNGGVCYPKSGKCDGQTNCPDLSDETGCPRCVGGTLSVTTPMVDVNEGASHIISCLGPPQCYPVLWRRSDLRVLPKERMAVAGSTLFITKAVKDDDGVYQCLSGNQSASFTLTVHAKPTLVLHPLGTSHNITSGHSLRIMCNSSSPYVQWRYVNQDGQWPSGVERQAQGRELVLSRAHPSMSGIYQCEALWGTGYGAKISTNVSVVVERVRCNPTSQWACVDGSECITRQQWCDGQPQCGDASDEVNCPKCHYGTLEIRPPSLSLSKGKSGQLQCIAPPQCQPISWRRADGSPLGSHLTVHQDKLLLSSAQLADTGIYHCVSGTTVAAANITVAEDVLLQLVDTADFLLFPYGAEQRALCQAVGGRHQPEWVREDGKLLTVGGNIRSLFMGQGRAQLVFQSPTFEASGVYKCIVPWSPQSGVRLMVYVQSVTCDARSERRCNDGKKCIPLSQVCNGRYDCFDGSDEHKCSTCRGQLQITPTVHTTVADTLVVFRCQVPSSDCSPVVWEREDGRPMPSDRWIAPGNTLVILSTRHEDSGGIVCRFGQTTRAIARLEVMGLQLQLNITGDTLRLSRGGSGAVSCKSNMEQPVWIAPENQHVWNYGVRYDYPARGRMDIRFTNVQPRAAGVYQCVVRTSQGHSKKVHLNVIVE